MSYGHAARGGARLRLARQARAYSQQQLAEMAGVSRQAIAAVEAGLSDPSLRTALALASALGMTVEELFGSATPVPSLAAKPVAPLGGQGARAALAPVGEEYVAFPLQGTSTSRAGFLPADALASGPDNGPWQPRTVQPIGPPRLTLIAAGCDPALPLLETPLGLLDPRSASPGGRARAAKHSNWPPTGWCTRPGHTCAGQTANTTSSRPPSYCPRVAR